MSVRTCPLLGSAALKEKHLPASFLHSFKLRDQNYSSPRNISKPARNSRKFPSSILGGNMCFLSITCVSFVFLFRRNFSSSVLVAICGEYIFHRCNVLFNVYLDQSLYNNETPKILQIYVNILRVSGQVSGQVQVYA